MKIIERLTNSSLCIGLLRIYSYLSLRLNAKEKQYNWPAVRNAGTLQNLETIMLNSRGYWRKDKYLDIISIPEKLQAVIDGVFLPADNLDCDEFARYCAAVLTLMKHPAIEDIKMQSVIYISQHNKKKRGHFVCSFKYMTVYNHIGNWGWAKTSKSGRLMRTQLDVAKDVADRANNNSVLITSWTVNHDTLKGWSKVT
jgi:hypothetical protein